MAGKQEQKSVNKVRRRTVSSTAVVSQHDSKGRSMGGLLIFALILLLGLVISLLALLPQFFFRKLTVKGNQRVTTEAITQQLALREGQHLFLEISGSIGERLTLHYAESARRLIELNPYIEEASVRVRIPYEVEVTIKERIPIACFYSNNMYYVVDAKRCVLEVGRSASIQGELPRIEGVLMGNLEPGDFINEDASRQLERVMALMDAILRADRDAQDGQTLLGRIERIYPYSANTLYLRLRKIEAATEEAKTIDVRLNPADNLEGDIQWLRNAFNQGAFGKLKEGVLDLSGVQQVFSPSETLPAMPKEATGSQSQPQTSTSVVSTSLNSSTQQETHRETRKDGE